MPGNTILVAGPAGTGKTSLVDEVSQTLEINGVDIDEKFVEMYGPVGRYGERFGWRSYFRKQSAVIHKVLDECDEADGLFLVALPASALAHIEFNDICFHNKKRIFGRYTLIALLANERDFQGAELSIGRQRGRGYKIDVEYKKRLYIYQAPRYRALADHVVINDGLLKAALEELRQLLIVEWQI